MPTPVTFTSIYTDEETNTGLTTYKRWQDEQDRNRTSKDWTLPNHAEQLSTAPLIPQTHTNPRTCGPEVMEKTPMAAAHDTTRTLWIIETGAETATTAMTMIGLTPLLVHQTDEETYWQEEEGGCTKPYNLSRTHQEQTSEPCPNRTNRMDDTSTKGARLQHNNRKSSSHQSPLESEGTRLDRNNPIMEHQELRGKGIAHHSRTRRTYGYNLGNKNWHHPQQGTRGIHQSNKPLPNRSPKTHYHNVRQQKVPRR
jgi:hypothetical protein